MESAKVRSLEISVIEIPEMIVTLLSVRKDTSIAYRVHDWSYE